MLKINNLHAQAMDKPILKGLTMEVKPGEVHAIMGPNGSGKSTFASILAGKEDYVVTEGSVIYQNQNLLDLSVHERALLGVFLAFQYPVAVPGLSNVNFLKTAVNNLRKHQGQEPLDAYDFLAKAKSLALQVGLGESFLSRGLNDEFSGGEKKRNEIMQMLMLEPNLCVLDETDSGLDIDALKTVASGVNTQRNKDRMFIVVTHYQRLLDYIVPDFVHVLINGQIIKSGDATLAKELEVKGYGWLMAHQGNTL
ncbi:Fe-S cluster assembly ATPase SufC [Gammaproteobacteria bacterium]|nr:Fe-S cluster assembly ATPase SufC [Gammaproteobacteria bacterium]